VDFRKADNLLGTEWDSPATTPALELDASSVALGGKRLVFDAAAAGVGNGKLEGLAVLPAPSSRTTPRPASTPTPSRRGPWPSADP